MARYYPSVSSTLCHSDTGKMGYKTNYELHTRKSTTSPQNMREYPAEAYLSPLANLYPHVFALQLQPESSFWSYASYSPNPRFSGSKSSCNSWTRIHSPLEPVEDDDIPSGVSSNNSRFVSKLRRILRKETSHRRYFSSPHPHASISCPFRYRLNSTASST